MTTLGTIGRFVYAVPFLVFGAFHFIRGADMAGAVPVPGGVFWVYLTGAALIAAALAIMAGKLASLASALLGLMLLSFALTIHLPAVLGAADQTAMQMSMSGLLKDTALAGAAWVLAGVFAAGETRAAVGQHDIGVHEEAARPRAAA